LEINLDSTFSRFNGNLANHYHFRCEKCRRIFDIDEPVDDDINERMALKNVL
jgi:Fur family peroxide stress response transcriptional regulator